MIESGVPGLSISFWHGLWTTEGTPKEVVDRLDAAVINALADPAVRSASKRWAKSYSRAINKTLKRSRRTKKPRLRSGGQLSKPLTSSWRVTNIGR